MSSTKAFVRVDGDARATLVALDEIAEIAGGRGRGATVELRTRDGRTYTTTWPLRADEFRVQNDGTLRTNESAERMRRDRKERQRAAKLHE